VSIDAFSLDGYLDNAHAGNPNAGRTDGTQAAVDHFLACVKARGAPVTASLVGGGAMGVIQTSRKSRQQISLNNQSTWTPILQALRGSITDLYLYGAWVGAGNDGAQFLYELAKVTGAKVWGPTGLLYCSSYGAFTLEPGGGWQSATPNQRPVPIQPPQPISRMAKAPTSLPVGEANAHAAFDAAGRALDPEAAKALVAEVLWDQAFQPADEPGARITGRLQLGFEGTPTQMSFVIYDHAVLRDEHEPTVFYHATPRFREIALGE
jgi:hypothetical protein